MNEKLTQLAKQAQVEHCISHVRLEEFAHLIVKECINACKDQRGIYNKLRRASTEGDLDFWKYVEGGHACDSINSRITKIFPGAYYP